MSVSLFMHAMPFRLLIPTYLLVGCIVMLLVNELSYGTIPRREFIRGMLIWPVLFVHAAAFFIAEIKGKSRG